MGQQTDFEKIRRNNERLQQVATLLAPAERSDICAKILRHVLYWWGMAEKCGNMPGRWIFQPHSQLANKCGLRNEQQSKRGVAILCKADLIEAKVRKINGTPRLHLQLNHETEKLLAHLSSTFPDDDAPLFERRAFQRVWDQALRLDLRNSDLLEDQTLHHVMQKFLPIASLASVLHEVDRILKIASDRSLKTKGKSSVGTAKVTLSKKVSIPTLSKEVSLVTLSSEETGYSEEKDKEKETDMVTPCVTTGSPKKQLQGLGKESTSPSAPKTPHSPPAAMVVGAGSGAGTVSPAVSPDVKAKWKAEAKAQHGSGYSATATPRAAFETVWRDVYLKTYDAPHAAFTARQRGQVNHALARAATVGLQSDDVEAVRAFVGWCIEEWPLLTDRVKSGAGLYKTPLYPDVGFILKYVGIAYGVLDGIQKIQKAAPPPPQPAPAPVVAFDEYGIEVPHKYASVQAVQKYYKARWAAKKAIEDAAEDAAYLAEHGKWPDEY